MSAAASPFSLDGMDVVVIGGASGIGEASARLAARSGARVVVADRDQTAAGRLATEISTEGGLPSPGVWTFAPANRSRASSGVSKPKVSGPADSSPLPG